MCQRNLQRDLKQINSLVQQLRISIKYLLKQEKEIKVSELSVKSALEEDKEGNHEKNINNIIILLSFSYLGKN